jgi:hypothetical protein
MRHITLIFGLAFVGIVKMPVRLRSLCRGIETGLSPIRDPETHICFLWSDLEV